MALTDVFQPVYTADELEDTWVSWLQVEEQDRSLACSGPLDWFRPRLPEHSILNHQLKFNSQNRDGTLGNMEMV